MMRLPYAEGLPVRISAVRNVEGLPDRIFAVRKLCFHTLWQAHFEYEAGLSDRFHMHGDGHRKRTLYCHFQHLVGS